MATGQPGPCIGNTLAIPRLGLPALCMSDGPAGVRPALGVTQFPAGVTAAATWDRELIYNRSFAMGQEFRDQGVVSHPSAYLRTESHEANMVMLAAPRLWTRHRWPSRTKRAEREDVRGIRSGPLCCRRGFVLCRQGDPRCRSHRYGQAFHWVRAGKYRSKYGLITLRRD